VIGGSPSRSLVEDEQSAKQDCAPAEMKDGWLPTDVKRTSALRRVPSLEQIRYRPERGNEGDICAFELAQDASQLIVESPVGRMMVIVPGDTFLATPGYREATRSISGGLPAGGLVPGDYYWVLADSGVVGEVVDDSPLDEGYVGRVRYLGAVSGDDGGTLNIRQFAVKRSGDADRNAPVYLILGTSGNVGKTTAGVAVLRTLRMRGHTTVIALKATGTGSVAEIASYHDFGAAQAFDCIDFGLPGTYPAARSGIGDFLGNALDFCLSLPADALVVECGGDLLGANVLEFLVCLKARRSDPKIVLAAADALGALAAKRVLAEAGLTISFITGPCTDTPAMRSRTGALCGIPAVNLARSAY
jgi:hypothetical protein